MALSLLNAVDFTTAKDLKGFLLSTLSVENALREESAWHLWNSVFNLAVVSVEKPDRDRQVFARRL